jgi:two-component system nitrate/nitrite response regulator NarL
MKRILIVDDNMMVAQSLAYLLVEMDDGFVVNSKGNMEDAFTELEQSDPYDLILLDYDMPNINGLDGLKIIKQKYPNQIVAMISGLTDIHLVRNSIRHGAIGWIPKTVTGKALVHAIHLMVEGHEFIPTDIRQSLKRHDETWADISEKEQDIAELMCEGHSDKVIADLLDVSHHTVRTHVRSIYKKADVDNRTKFALKFRATEV